MLRKEEGEFLAEQLAGVEGTEAQGLVDTRPKGEELASQT